MKQSKELLTQEPEKVGTKSELAQKCLNRRYLSQNNEPAIRFLSHHHDNAAHRIENWLNSDMHSNAEHWETKRERFNKNNDGPKKFQIPNCTCSGKR